MHVHKDLLLLETEEHSAKDKTIKITIILAIIHMTNEAGSKNPAPTIVPTTKLITCKKIEISL